MGDHFFCIKKALIVKSLPILYWAGPAHTCEQTPENGMEIKIKDLQGIGRDHRGPSGKLRHLPEGARRFPEEYTRSTSREGAVRPIQFQGKDILHPRSRPSGFHADDGGADVYDGTTLDGLDDAVQSYIPVDPALCSDSLFSPFIRS